ncbi:M28 family metallopeptidase [Bacillus sp. MRMR6]|uniref:M28 family metallopeptidase n=1 Tax=Bacillus sp. MRMR6 TaxID=1928617 RepID=UPI00095311DA|nr:M28 family metallopeptidase [Bacillus sp. MRMR6]OLS37306.1 hypothetical protein BTR25_16235 [Bacillus sp. MRMR6]
MIQTTEAKDHLLNKVSEEHLMTFTKEISKEVRLSGSEEEKRSFEYAERTLREFGFQTQLFYRKALISLPIQSDLTVNGNQFSSITHSMATSTGESGLAAELVYVGDENYQDDISYTGKAVLIDGLATPAAVIKAQSKGAAATVFITADYTHEMIVSAVWGNPSMEDAENYPTIPVASVTYRNGQEIKALLTSSASSELQLKTEVLKEWRDIPTLIADYTFNPNSKDFLLFSGHIDSWHYGVMDNGSANATMLEVARVVSENKPEFQRNLRLAFWSGHSHGRYAGSTLYVDENYEELYDHCLLHLNIDSVGGIHSTVLTEGNTMAETKNLIGESINLVSEDQFEGSRFGRSGDQSFWGAGIPSALMGLSEQAPVDTPAMRAFSKLFGSGKGGGFGWWWHTTEDTIDKIDPQLLKRDCKIYLSIIFDFCSADLIPVQQSKAVEEITKVLKGYQAEFEFKGMLDTAFERLQTLNDTVKLIERYASDDKIVEQYKDEINGWNKTMSKSLVPINYVDKDVFGHDPALGQPPVPSIGKVIKKENLSKYDSNVIYTTLKRRINKMNFTLRELNQISSQLNHLLGSEASNE